MVAVRDPDIYQDSLKCLKRHKDTVSRHYKGRFVQIFLGLKFYQSAIPSIHSGTYISTELLQSLLDDLYTKTSRPLNECVLSLFEANHLARTGIVPHGRVSGSNIWRNNFNLQKGVGCYAPAEELSSRTFLRQSRKDCRHLLGDLGDGKCELCPTDARYRNEDHLKWLKIDPEGSGYSVVDLMNIENFTPYICPDNSKIPLLPLVIALYHDVSSQLFSNPRDDVRIEEFCLDFNFSESELRTYFDASPENALNAHIIKKASKLAFTKPHTKNTEFYEEAATPYGSKLGSQTAVTKKPVPNPVLTGTTTAPPQTHNGWEAEQFVLSALKDDKWEVYDVRRQQVGYDLLAKKKKRTIYVEVKSSVNLCSPTFTSREWEQAKNYKEDYIVAIIENFNSNGNNTIYWIPNPSIQCSASSRLTTNYSVARSSWTSASRRLRDI